MYERATHAVRAVVTQVIHAFLHNMPEVKMYPSATVISPAFKAAGTNTVTPLAMMR